MSPGGMFPAKLSLSEDSFIVSAQGEFSKWHSAWGREYRHPFFYSVEDPDPLSEVEDWERIGLGERETDDE
jgi:hypothetical protein